MQNLLASPYRTKRKRTLRWRRASTQRYPGQMYDSESGLHYNRFRDYEPGTGRYPQSDPLGQAGGMSTYSYVSSSPLRLVDPLGLAECDPNANDCRKMLYQILKKHAKLVSEFGAYDPVGDGIGGFRTYGGRLTVPGGHYKEIGDLQRGLKNDIQKYNKICRDGGGPGSPLPRYVDNDANRTVAEPVVPMPEMGGGAFEEIVQPAVYGVGALLLLVFMGLTGVGA